MGSKLSRNGIEIRSSVRFDLVLKARQKIIASVVWFVNLRSLDCCLCFGKGERQNFELQVVTLPRLW